MEQQLLYKYSKIELEQFALFEEAFDQKQEDVEFQTETQFSFDKTNLLLCCTMVSNMIQSGHPLLKAELNNYFLIAKETIESLRDGNRIKFTPNQLTQFASLSYGSMRGVIFSKTMGTALNQFLLPPVYFANLIDKSFIVEEAQ